MDRYTFRGKRLNDGEWIYGLPHHCGNRLLILSDQVVEFEEEWIALESWWTVDPATLGQCTGLKDKNGKVIFEGDLIKIGIWKAKVFFDDDKCGFYRQYLAVDDIDDREHYSMGEIDEDATEIIGTIHDNHDGEGE